MAKSKMKTQEKVDYSDKNSDPAVGVSLCIPRVFNNIGYKRIKDMFIRMNWGYVERVDVIQLRGFKRAYVHFKPGEWNMRSREAMQVLEAMKRREEVTVTYDEPWFWKIGISRSPRPSEAPKPKPRPKVQIGAGGGGVARVHQPRSPSISPRTPPSSPPLPPQDFPQLPNSENMYKRDLLTGMRVLQRERVRMEEGEVDE